jgi:2-polyprenyl-3-methyl-5-hydroxy-6-metoxy-1,4-benzoquinol methylase
MFRIAANKTTRDIAVEWDALASKRQQQIISGVDISYNRVILPAVLDLALQTKPNRILDAGCGIGILAVRLASMGKEVIGVDPSARSIEIAQLLSDRRISFIHAKLKILRLASLTLLIS